MFGKIIEDGELFQLSLDAQVFVEGFSAKPIAKWVVLFMDICRMGFLRPIKTEIFLRETSNIRLKFYNKEDRKEKEKNVRLINLYLRKCRFKNTVRGFTEEVETIQEWILKENPNLDSKLTELLAIAWLHDLRIHLSHDYSIQMIPGLMDIFTGLTDMGPERYLRIMDVQDLVMHMVRGEFDLLLKPAYRPANGNLLCFAMDKYAEQAQTIIRDWTGYHKNCLSVSSMPAVDMLLEAHENVWRLGFALENERLLTGGFHHDLIPTFSLLPNDWLMDLYRFHKELLEYRKGLEISEKSIAKMMADAMLMEKTLPVFMERINDFKIRFNKQSETDYLEAKDIIEKAKETVDWAMLAAEDDD